MADLTLEQISRAQNAVRDLNTRFVKPFRDLGELVDTFAQIANDLPAKRSELAKVENDLEATTHRLQQVERDAAAREKELEQHFAQVQRETAEALAIIQKPLAEAKQDLAHVQEGIAAKHAIAEREWASREKELQRSHDAKAQALNRDIVGLQTMKRDLEGELAKIKARFA